MTPPKQEQPLSRRERQIMDLIYARGSAGATQIVEAMTNPPSRTTVRTLLSILETKGHLKHKQVGREYVYQPTRPRRRAGRSALRRVMDTFFEGSLEQAVATHLADPQTMLRPIELERIARLIKEARKTGDS